MCVESSSRWAKAIISPHVRLSHTLGILLHAFSGGPAEAQIGRILRLSMANDGQGVEMRLQQPRSLTLDIIRPGV